MKKTLSIIVCIVLAFAFSSCTNSISKENSTESKTFSLDDLQFEGDYLIRSVYLSDKSNFIDEITIADNNFQGIGDFEDSVLKSIHIYEAEVIWNMDNNCFQLEKGYDIGDSGIVFNNTGLMYSSSMDTGEVCWLIENGDWKFEEFKVYNFCCTIEDEKFDSYFIYVLNDQKQSLVPITTNELEHKYVNCIIKDSGLHLAKFNGIENDGSEPDFDYDENELAHYVTVEDDSY